MQLEKVAQLKEKRIVDEQQKQEDIDQNYKEKLEKVEQEKLTQLEKVTKLKEKRISEEQQEKERLDQLHKEKIAKEKTEKTRRTRVKKIKS